MKLLYAPTSPFVRKVMVCAHLTGQAGQIEWLASAAHPVNRDARIAGHNPLAKVPTLILPDGKALYDSRVICEYLAEAAGDTQLFPAGPARWVALTRQALGDGLLDAALLARYEQRPARPRSSGRSGARHSWSRCRPAWRTSRDRRTICRRRFRASAT
mgnify:CR=1 FL=1